MFARTAFAGVAICMVGAAMAWKAPANADEKKNPVAVSPESVAAGKKIWMKECASCHGNAGKGDGEKSKELSESPGDLSDSKEMGGQSDGALYWKITTGKKPMPPFLGKLSEEQRWQTVNYIRSISGGAKSGAADTATTAAK
jgi:mono/diheme cytochrome c family protein